MEIQKINKKQISFDPQNPRKEFDAEELEILQESIEKDGQKEPVHLEQLGKDSYIVNEGHKRVSAIQKSKKLDYVMAIVEKKLSPEDRLLKQIIIDTHRKNWSMYDRDKAWKRLWDMGKYDAASFAKKISVTKGMAETFIDRMNLGTDFIGKMKNISATNIDETSRIKDSNMRKKILLYADKENLGRKDIRKLAGVTQKVSKDVVNEVVTGKISIDDAENMVGLKEKDQQTALFTTKALNQHKKKLKKMIGKGDIGDVEIVRNTTNKVTEFQKRIFKLSSDIRLMSLDLEDFSKSKEKISKIKNTPIEKILVSCLNELEDKAIPSIKNIKKVLKELEAFK